VNALYAALGNIDRIAPIIPGVLERLRGMRIVHADAASVTSGIKDVGERMGKMEKEVKEWEEVLGQVEAGVKGVAGLVAGVMERIEGVVTGLEMRVEKLEV
jgi:nuclear migration protein JNM1